MQQDQWNREDKSLCELNINIIMRLDQWQEFALKKKKINYPHANQVKSQENMALCKRNT